MCKYIAYIASFWVLVSCSSTDSTEDIPVATQETPTTVQQPKSPDTQSSDSEKEVTPEQLAESITAKTVYNHAYQENYNADQITTILAQAHNAYILIDPSFVEGISTIVTTLKANGNEIGAYISIGTGETYRNDYEAMQPYLVTTPWGRWPNEFFVNETTTGILPLMKARIDQIALWGFDWVEFDNMDWIFDSQLRATYGFEVTTAEGIAYYQELCDYAHSKGMKCMAKNRVDERSNFDGVTYESFHDNLNWWDVSEALRFVNEGKFVIINHYNETDCKGVYEMYKEIYSDRISFICEDANVKRYVHFNEVL